MSSSRPLSPEQQRQHDRLTNDLEYFCRQCLRIKLKEGGEAPFEWNKAQKYLHERIEDQKRRTGRVRMFILKGRQQGISTYIAARGYHRTTRRRGFRAFILSHHSSTTGTLFDIVDKYHEGCPPAVKPQQTMNNNRQMKFNNGSQYTVGTAGTGEIGRGDTNHFFHWSEVAFSENVSKLLAGAFQTVADIDGTEKLLESTANGMGNYFYNGCMAALAGDDEYELVFIPWYWQPEYRARIKDDFEPTDEEISLMEMYELDRHQLQWRRNKIREFEKDGRDGVRSFKQEYPCTVREAFQASGEQLIDADAIAKAKKAHIRDDGAPLIVGVDPGPVRDRTCASARRGRQWIKTDTYIGHGPMEMAGKLARQIDREGVDKMFIDYAEGRGIVDRLHELGYRDVVMGISFSQKPIDEARYTNKRAEMAGEMKTWLEDDAGVDIPDDDKIEVELGVIPPFKTSSNGKLQLISKDDIKKLYGGKSPDIFDSIVLTFAMPVQRTYNREGRIRKLQKSNNSELTAMNRRRQNSKASDDWDTDEPKGWSRSQSPHRRR